MTVVRSALWLEMAPLSGKPYCWRAVGSELSSRLPATCSSATWYLPGPFGGSRLHTVEADGMPVLEGLYFNSKADQAAVTRRMSGAERSMLNNLWRERPTASARLRLLLTGTPLQVSVWRALTNIPAGETRSYSEVAHSAGYPRAVRAVASAVGANPVSWLVPCHRVIRSDGSLGGYHWGLEMKRAMLACDTGEKLFV